MKSLKSILASVALVASVGALGLENNDPGFGVQAGLNFDTAKSPAAISSETHTGFSVGMNLDLPLSSNFSIQPEVNYSRRGLNLVDAGSVTANVYQHAIEVPVFAKVTFGEKVRPYLFAGPMGTWNISSEVTGQIGGQAASSSFNPKTFDLAVVGGVGIEVGSFFANARYILGVVDIEENSAEWKSRGFRLMAGLRF